MTELDNLNFIDEQLNNGKFKKCPSCNIIYDKDNACNYVKCPACNTEFCWFCGNKKGPLCPFGNIGHNSH